MAPQIRTIAGPADFAAAFNVSRETIQRLETYAALLRRWQKTVNLVGASTLDAIWHRHFADSAQIVRLAPAAQSWLDLGSGAGFPGLVVAILLAGRDPPPPGGVPSPLVEEGQGGGYGRTAVAGIPPTPDLSPQGGGEARVTLIESDTRKVAFLREVARKTGIGVDILSTRIETAATQSKLTRPEVITARALAPLDRLFGLAANLSSPTTVGIYLKGREAAAEIETAANTWDFAFETIASLTDAAGRIVVIRNLQPKSKD